jgi:long-chain acyl-CoA synthetase
MLPDIPLVGKSSESRGDNVIDQIKWGIEFGLSETVFGSELSDLRVWAPCRKGEEDPMIKPPPASLSGLLDRGLMLDPDQPALITIDESWSWRQLDRASKCYASQLQLLGLKRGDRIASLMPNCASLVIHYLACLSSGFVIAPLNYRYTSREINHALSVSGSKALLVDVERSGDVSESNPGHLPLGAIVHGSRQHEGLRFEAMIDGPSSPYTLSTPDQSDPAAIFFTSGSTGPAKGVTHSFGSLGAVIASAAHGCRTGPNDVVLLTGSISHIGAFMDMFMSLSVGGAVVVSRHFDGPSLLSLLRAHRPTICISLPVVLHELIRTETAAREDFISLRLCGAGGDKVPETLIQEVAALTGLAVNEQYGMSEFGAAMINPLEGPIKSGSVGRASPGYQLSIRDERFGELPSGIAGRLWVKSLSNMIGYWGDPGATKEVSRDGWLDTGDVMRMDEDGYLWFVGRAKQLIIHDGSNISPQEVEDALMAHPSVAVAGVIGVPDAVHGENVHAFVTLREGKTRPMQDELIDFARARVGYKAPEQIIVLDDMPLNASDKVDRRALKALHGETGGKK